MRKVLIALLLLAVAAAGVYWFFFYSDRSFPESVLPENSSAYIYFPGVDRIREEAEQTLLWKRISSSQRKELYRYQLESLIRFTESAVGVDPRPFLKQFSREVGLAMVPVTGDVQSGALIAYIRSEKEMRNFLEMKLDPSLKRRFPDLKKSPVQYQNREYYKYGSSTFKHGISPCYAFIDHHLIVTTSEVGMKIVCDVKAKKVPSLKKSDILDDAKSKVRSKNGILFFLNAKSALAALKARLPARAQPFWPAFLKVSGIEAVHAFLYHLGFKGEGFQEEGYVFVDRKKQGFTKAYMEQRPQKLSGLNFLPAGSAIRTFLML